MSCPVASRETKAAYYCSREVGHDGPCAAHPVGIRFAQADDYPAIAKIIEENYGKAWATVGREVKLWLEDPTSMATFYVLDRSDGTILGFGGYAQSWMDWETYELFWITLAKDIQGQGFGRRLVDGLLAHCSGAKRVILWSDKQGFWEKMGFREFSPNLMIRNL